MESPESSNATATPSASAGAVPVPLGSSPMESKTEAPSKASPKGIDPADASIFPEGEPRIRPPLKEQTTPEKSGEPGKQVVPSADVPLTKGDQSKVDALLNEIEEGYREIPPRLIKFPEAQERWLSLLPEAENALSKRPLERKDIIAARLAVTRVKIQLATTTASRTSFFVIVAIIYIMAILVVAGIGFGWLKYLNEEKPTLVLGVPLQIWVWSVIGSLTSMLLRAGRFPFSETSEALRWVL